MAEVEVRALRAGDGAGCARAWLDAARYYVGMDPENFQLPAEDGLAGWFEQDHADDGHPVLRQDRLGYVRHGVIFRKYLS